MNSFCFHCVYTAAKVLKSPLDLGIELQWEFLDSPLFWKYGVASEKVKIFILVLPFLPQVFHLFFSFWKMTEFLIVIMTVLE